MGFTNSSSPKNDSEVVNEKQEKINVVPAIATIVTSSTECCKSCQRNKYFAVLQGLFNIVLIVLLIILFIMVNNMRSNIEDNLLPHRRTKRLHEDTIRKQYSVGSESMKNNESSRKNTTLPPTQRSRISTKASTTFKKVQLLEKLEVLDTVVEPHLRVRPARQDYQRKKPSYEKPKLENVTLNNGTQCTCIGQPGPEGPPGRTGRRGKRGKKGHDGSRGAKGPHGPKGLRGPPGKAGPRGDVGTIGLPGPQGSKGDKGDPGRASVRDLPVVHVTGYQVLKELTKMPKGILTNWETKDGFATVNKMGFSQGFMTIKEFGYYHVYSQVFFQADEPGIDPHLLHYVYFFRKERGTKETSKYIILRGFLTRPEHLHNGQGFYTTSASGVFLLMPGDQLAIGVEQVHLPLISYEESATYFGAYMI